MCLCQNTVFLENGKSSYDKYLILLHCFLFWLCSKGGWIHEYGRVSESWVIFTHNCSQTGVLFYAKPENSHSTETLTCLWIEHEMIMYW